MDEPITETSVDELLDRLSTVPDNADVNIEYVQINQPLAPNVQVEVTGVVTVGQLRRLLLTRQEF